MFASPTEIPQIHLTALLTRETFLHSPPIFLMVEVMDTDARDPAARCIVKAVSFPVVPMLRLPSWEGTGGDCPCSPRRGVLSQGLLLQCVHNAQPDTISVLLSVSAAKRSKPVPFSDQRCLWGHFLGRTLQSCSFELPHPVSCNLGPSCSYGGQSLLLWDISICRRTQGAPVLKGKRGLV